MFHDGLDVTASFLSVEDKIISIENVSGLGLTLNITDGKSEKLNVQLDVEDVDKMLFVLKEARKNIKRNE